MKIMIINPHAGSKEYGPQYRTYYFAKELVGLGHKVTVMAASYSHLRNKNPEIPHNFFEEIQDGIKYVFVKIKKYENTTAGRLSAVNSFVRKIRYSSRLLHARFRPDVIMATGQSPQNMRSAAALAKHDENVRICYEINELPYDYSRTSKIISNRTFYDKRIRKAEIYAFEHADLIVSAFPKIGKYIENLGFYNTNWVYISSGILPDCYEQSSPEEGVRALIEKLHSEGKYVIMYAGRFGDDDSVDALVDAAEKLPENAHIVFVGEGGNRQNIIKQIEKNNSRNITVMPSVEHASFVPTLELADALYYGLKRSVQYSFGINHEKLYEFMEAAKPIIFGAAVGDDIIAKAECGITIEPENSKAIVKAVEELMRLSPIAATAMGENGRAYVRENYDYNRQAQRLAFVLSLQTDTVVG